jgi:2-methylcitrate dehydratase PrpD
VKESGGVTSRIAEFIARASLDDVPPQAVERAKKHIADSIATMIAGTFSDLAPVLRSYVGQAAPSGQVPVIGWGDLTTSELAAFANGTLGHALDYDDANGVLHGHATGITVAALLAAPEARTKDGKSFVEAYVVGTEAATRIVQGLGRNPANNPGWHLTGVMGVLSAVAALAKFRGLNHEETCRAFGIAGSAASGLQKNFGTMTKPFHSGWGARSATAAIDLARLGWTASERIFDLPGGFSAVYGAEGADPERIPELFGDPWIFSQTEVGLSLKLYPCCYGTHRSIEAVRSITGGVPVDPASVVSVQVRVPPAGLKALLYSRPKTGLQGKFSMEYTLAATLVDGSVGLASFNESAVNRPDVQRLLEVMDVAEDPRCAVLGPEDVAAAGGVPDYAEVTLTLKDADPVVRRVYAALGAPSRELSWEAVGEKFADCAAWSGVDPQHSAAAFAELTLLDRGKDLGSIVDRLRIDEQRARGDFS